MNKRDPIEVARHTLMWGSEEAKRDNPTKKFSDFNFDMNFRGARVKKVKEQSQYTTVFLEGSSLDDEYDYLAVCIMERTGPIFIRKYISLEIIIEISKKTVEARNAYKVHYHAGTNLSFTPRDSLVLPHK